VAALERLLDRAGAVPRWHDTYVATFPDQARRAAEAVDAAHRSRQAAAPGAGWAASAEPSGHDPLLVGVKDTVAVRERAPTAGARAPVTDGGWDAAVIVALRRHGAIVVGQQRAQLFGIGLEWPQVANAWDRHRHPGGSSVGAGVSVALGTATVAIGTDTLGSVRKPAAINGVVGFRPTPGVVPVAGIVPFPTVFEGIGWVTPDVATARRVLAAVSQGAPGSTGAGVEQGCVEVPRRLGVLGHDDGQVDRAVRGALRDAADLLSDIGWVVEPRRLPEHDEAVEAVHQVVSADVVTRHRAWLDRHRGGRPSWFHQWLRHAGPGVAPPRAARMVGAGRRAVRSLLATVDALVVPTVEIPPGRRGEMVGTDGLITAAVLRRYCRWTALATVAGAPAVTIPWGRDPSGLPIGVQVIGSPGADTAVLSMAEVLHALAPG